MRQVSILFLKIIEYIIGKIFGDHELKHFIVNYKICAIKQLHLFKQEYF